VRFASSRDIRWYTAPKFSVGDRGVWLLGAPQPVAPGIAAFAGLLAGFDGGLWASRYATIDARVAMGYELTVIASVVVGGVAIRGGLQPAVRVPALFLGATLIVFPLHVRLVALASGVISFVALPARAWPHVRFFRGLVVAEWARPAPLD
jgi:hypothetical protein